MAKTVEWTEHDAYQAAVGPNGNIGAWVVDANGRYLVFTEDPSECGDDLSMVEDLDHFETLAEAQKAALEAAEKLVK